ncbi:MAG: CNNM domain-containing protein [Planctomycetota bacterium]|nr:CNNM domain-containing protein [Planctomycetota bacterium]
MFAVIPPQEWAVAGGMLALIVSSGVVSGSETAFFSLEDGQVETMREHDRMGRLVATLLDTRPRLLLVILILNNVINIAYFALASWWAGRHADSTVLAASIGLGALTALILLGEIVPKVFATSRPEAMSRLFAPVMWLSEIVLKPMCRIVERLLSRLLTESQETDLVSGDELKLVIEHSRDHGVVSELVHDRLIEVVDLSSTPAGSAMTHRIDCPGIKQNATHDDAVAALREHQASHLLLYDDNDNCVGILSVQKLLKRGRPAKRASKPLFIPEGAQLAQVLDLFKTTRRTAGVVVDEYGGTLGLLTLAHVGNELLGPGASSDMPDQDEPQQIDASHWRVPGLLSLEAWAPLLNDEDAAGCTTIGGFVTKMLGSVPAVGDRLLYNNLLFQVEAVEGRRIRTISIEKLSANKARRMTREQKAR